ncbi:MAG TPA: single-stranded-DNA-specific exonuclease RecJ [Candidatus Limnocylindrales bacterium]|nr:single-stranded-DNA-specific exonuclease RecJ [Candidatus Limnocylindrales bacterium]
MLEPRFRWVFPASMTVDPTHVAAGERLGVPARVTTLLAARGVTTESDLAAFFGPPEAALHDPSLLPDAAPFVDRIAAARRGGESVLVFGDFDADGLTGLAILILALRALGVDARPYVPSRLEEGHGLSLAAVETAAATGIRVIVTVDCGTTSVAEVAAANARGIDVLVTDHHRVPAVLPAALAVVNPQRADSSYPDRRLAGSGVAFKLAQLLLSTEPGGAEAALDLADLAAIGTVADVAPVLGENRAIARIGLDRLRRGARPGLAALLARGGIDPKSADLETVSFAIAPRLNAAGRVGEALDAAKLLLAADPAEAAALADRLEAANKTRRDLTKGAIDEARIVVGAAGDADSGVTIVRGDWPVGIVGLVASRLVDDLGRPAIVGANIGSTVRASCRSDGSIDLGAALEACHDLFTRYGGHAGAAGFELPADRWDAFRTRFELLVESASPTDRRPVLALDLALAASEVDYALHRDLLRVGPCGPGNPDPVVAILGLTVTRVRAATGGHTQLTLRRVRDVLDAIAFDRADLAESVVVGDLVDVVGRLASRRFGGLESLQIEIRDVARAGAHADAAAILDSGAPGAVAVAVAS